MIEIRLPEDDIEEHRISNKTLESAMSLLKLYTFIIHMFQTIFKLSDTAMSVFFCVLCYFPPNYESDLTSLFKLFHFKVPTQCTQCLNIGFKNYFKWWEKIIYRICMLINMSYSVLKGWVYYKMFQWCFTVKKCCFQWFPSHPQSQQLLLVEQFSWRMCSLLQVNSCYIHP